MIQSENITELMASIIAVESELVTMPKNKSGYGYKYTDLDTIVSAIKPILAKHKVGYMQSVGGINGYTLTTRVFNDKGQYIEDTVELPNISGTKNNAAQELGMAITYMRRYALCAMLGITSDEDVDAAPPRPEPRQDARKPERKPDVQKEEMAGGESTPEESARIKTLLSAKYSTGQAVFSRKEMETYSGYRKQKTAAELIAFIETALRNRRPDAPELAA